MKALYAALYLFCVYYTHIGYNRFIAAQAAMDWTAMTEGAVLVMVTFPWTGKLIRALLRPGRGA